METNDRPINGICIDGKFYEAVLMGLGCGNCVLNGAGCKRCCSVFGLEATFRFSQSLTDKINGK